MNTVRITNKELAIIYNLTKNSKDKSVKDLNKKVDDELSRRGAWL